MGRLARRYYSKTYKWSDMATIWFTSNFVIRDTVNWVSVINIYEILFKEFNRLHFFTGIILKYQRSHLMS